MAGRPCKVCTSPKRAQIEAAMTAGTPVGEIAALAGCSRMAISRHQSHATAPAVRQGRAARPANDRAVKAIVAAPGATLAEKADWWEAKLKALVARAEEQLVPGYEAQASRTVVQAVNAGRGFLEFSVKLERERRLQRRLDLQEFFGSAEWVAWQHGLREALGLVPGAWEAFAAHVKRGTANG